MNFQANTKSDLLSQLDMLIGQYQAVISATPVDKMNIQLNNKWSICQNIDHINKSNQLTSIGYKTPGIILGLTFGKAKVPSRSTEEIIRLYQAELSKGAKSPKLFEAGKSNLKDKTVLQEKYHAQMSALKSNIDSWSEADLEKYKMIHPILGRLTAKEMLSFTVYHQFHHMNTIQRILEQL